MTIIDQFILLAILVYIPLIFECLPTIHINQLILGKWYVFILITIPLSYIVAFPVVSAILVSPWFLYGTTKAWQALKQFLTFPSMETISGLTGIMFLPIAATTLIISHLELQILDFSVTIIRLTALHFHFAGVLVPILNGLVGHQFKTTRIKGKQWQLYRVLSFNIIVGTPLVALEITLSTPIPVFGIIAVGIFAGSLMFQSLFVLIFIIRTTHLTLVSGVFGIAHLCLISAMVLAMIYAVGVGW